jgi:putative aldouronate transport system substrate-binding protein
MKKQGRISWVSMLSIILIISLLVTACGTEVSTGGKQESGGANNDPLQMAMFLQLYNEVPDMKNAYWQELQKKTNTKIDIQWVPSGEYFNKLDLMLSTGDVPEVLVLNTATRPTNLSALKNGMFWDLTPFLGDFSNYPNLKKTTQVGVYNYTKVDGKNFTLPRMRGSVNASIMVRKDWLDKLKIPMPTTLDEYKEALRAVVKAKPGTLGFIGDGELGIGDADLSFQAAFGVYDPTYNNEGGRIHNRLTPQYADMVEWLRGLNAEGLMSKEFFTMKRGQAEDLFSSGKAFSYGRSINRDWLYTDSNRKVDPDAFVRSVQLKGPKGHAIRLDSGYSNEFAISKKVPEEKVKRILAFFEQTASPEMSKFGSFGIEGVHYNEKDGRPVLTEQGIQEVNTTSSQPLVMEHNQYAKVNNTAAPEAFNQETRELTKAWEQLGKVDHFTIIISDTWPKIWSKYQKEWESQSVKAIAGQITMDEYRKYLDSLRNMPDFQKAFKEFSEDEKLKITKK